MSAFLAAMGPIVLFWTVPLFPMVYTGIVATLEALAEVARRRPATSVHLEPAPAEVTA